MFESTPECDDKPKMAREPKHARLLCMLLMTFGFFVVEVVVSRLTSSLSMLSDSFHMLSDVMALVVALVAVKLAEKTHSTKKNTFGWVRAEVMGALVNAVFLTALCFTIVLEAIERFTDPQEVRRPILLAVVGSVGLAVNVLGLCLFHRHAGRGHRHAHGNKRAANHRSHNTENGYFVGEANNSAGDHNSLTDVRLQTEMEDRGDTEAQTTDDSGSEELEQSPSSASELNMHGVFLHVLGDALGSVIVVINALIFNFVWEPCTELDEGCVNECGKSHSPDRSGVDPLQDVTHSASRRAGPCWVLYVDPTLCIIMVGILLYTTFPLLKESALVLLQTVPKQINMRKLKKRLLSLDGVLALHELHIWQLAGSRIIATAHIKCQNPMSYMEVAKRIKAFFHNEGIHATTIQPEFVTFDPDYRNSLCDLSCETQCAPKLCCTSADKDNAGSNKTTNTEGATSALDVIIEDPEQAAEAQASSPSDQ